MPITIPKKTTPATEPAPAVVATITKEDSKTGVQVTETEVVGEAPAEPNQQPDAWLGMEMGITINIGNYESIKVSVALSAPVTDGDLETAYSQIKDWVEGKVNEIVTEIKEG